jgi:stage IV sporulation protein FB
MHEQEAMKHLEPQHNRFDLRCRLAGVGVRVTPLFWLSSAILGIRYLADPNGGSLGYFLFWMTAVLVSVLLHELGHVLACRLFGLQPEVVLSGLGGVTLGIDELKRPWQRLVTLLAGPAMGFLIVAGIWGITFIPFPQVLRDWGWDTSIATGIAILLWINLYWSVLNVVPLWPLDGGRMACEIGEGLFGRKGRVAGVVLSIITAGLLAVGLVIQLSWHLRFPYDPRYLLYLEQFIVLLMYAFLLWLRGFRELWPDQAEVGS